MARIHIFMMLVISVSTELIFASQLELFRKYDTEMKRGKDLSAIANLYDENRVVPYTEEEKEGILAQHREFRSQVNPEASDMEYMYWNDDLATLAGLWASVCYLGHGHPNSPLLAEFGALGQNLLFSSGQLNLPPSGLSAVVAWHNNEVNSYNYTTHTCLPKKMCGHYTQIVWASSKEVGCSRAFCKVLIDRNGNQTTDINKWIRACEYSPSGNYKGQKPYKTGPSCTECASGVGQCYNNTCTSCSEHNENCECRQICNNCGTLDETECKCACMDGWHGTSCSTVCEDTHRYCWENPGWPNPSVCGKNPDIPEGCPLMCGVCEEANGKKCEPDGL